jgi:hypothetical protein
VRLGFVDLEDPVWRSLGLISCLVLVLACHPNPSESDTKTPEDFGLTFGSGGGVTGRWQGFTLEPDGDLVRWQGSMAGANEQPAGTLTGEQRAALWRAIQGAKFFEHNQDERGNMTRRISVTASQKTHHAYWPMGSTGPGIHDLDRLFETCERIASETRPPATN